MAAPPTPVDVFIPPGPDPESRVFVDAADPVVIATSFLQWDAAGVVGGMLRVSLPNSSMLNAFALKCRMDRSPAGLIAARPINPLTLRLTAGAWSRLLTGVRDHGLANAAPTLGPPGRSHLPESGRPGSIVISLTITVSKRPLSLVQINKALNVRPIAHHLTQFSTPHPPSLRAPKRGECGAGTSESIRKHG